MKENPKHIQAQKEGKIPFEFVPLASIAGASRVLQHGASKYGKKNWRIDHIKASTYQGAFMRHLSAYYDGELVDPDSGESHLSHIMANCLVMLDAESRGTLINDINDKETKDANQPTDQTPSCDRTRPTEGDDTDDDAGRTGHTGCLFCFSEDTAGVQR